MGCCLSTVYNEINRGRINGEYDPDYAQSISSKKQKLHGRYSHLLLDRNLAEIISKYILIDDFSPETVCRILKEQGIYCPSKATIYAAIDKGLIPNVSRASLQRKTTTMFSHGLIQIPSWIRKELNFNDGDEFHISVVDQKIIIEK